jgi:hypothetical protein
MNNDTQSRRVPERILKIHRRWTGQVKVLQTVHVLLVVTATTASILAAAGLGKGWSPVVENPLSIVAAVAIGLVSAFELGNKANSFRNAWRVLHAAIMRFEEDAAYSVNQLIGEYEAAEKLIGDTKATPTP